MTDQKVGVALLTVTSILFAFHPGFPSAVALIAATSLYAGLSFLKWKEPKDLAQLKEEMKVVKDKIDAMTLLFNMRSVK